ncbi:FHA domain-containing protein [Microbispora sp. RL4-1S]|uniref:FHA domain-containing protein n=1 Tax=Microbispora oryzae TaxID=2806554 RepID=A0A940WI60_9ACTN|nr:FHA domain-containing protein [Microbispora oryzae]MBP2703672.1 FHA domain-containing protein [Microbispora oryzae]
MTEQGVGVVRPLPGEGVVAHVNGLLLVCAAAEQPVEELLGALNETATTGGDGRALARRVAQVLARAMDRSIGGEPVTCAVAGPAGGGVAVLVSGAALAVVSGGPDGEVRLAGRDALTWTDRLVNGPVTRIELRLPGAGQAGPYARLDGGVVGGAGIECDFSQSGELAFPPLPPRPPHGQPYQPPAPGLPEPISPREPLVPPPPMPPGPVPPAVPPEPGLAPPYPSQPPQPVSSPYLPQPSQPLAPPPPISDPASSGPFGPLPPYLGTPQPDQQPPLPESVPGPVSGPQPVQEPGQDPHPLYDTGPDLPQPYDRPGGEDRPRQDAGGAPFEPAPPYEPPAYDPTAFDGPAFEGPGFDGPAFEKSGFEKSGFEGPGFEGSAYEPAAHAAPAAQEEDAGEATQLDVTPERDSRPMVYGVDCTNDHFNDPRATYCSICGVPIDQRAVVPYKGPRPQLGVLQLDDGMSLPLDGDYVLGRDPERAAEVQSGEARPARVTSPDGSVSRRHLRVFLENWDVNLLDLGSVNGTQIQPPGDPNFYDIPPNEPVPILPGTTVRVGVSRTMRYEGLRNA